MRCLGSTTAKLAPVRSGRVTSGSTAVAPSWTFWSATGRAPSAVVPAPGDQSTRPACTPANGELRSVEAEDEFGDATGLALPFDLHRSVEQSLHAVGDFLHVAELHGEAVLLPFLERRRETDLVEPVVDHHPEVLHLDELEEDPGDQGEREVPVRDRLLERRFAAGALAVDVDPLVVAGRVGELHDRLVRHLAPAGDAQLLAH